MEGSPSEHDAIVDAAVMTNSSGVNDVSTAMAQGVAVPTTRRQEVPVEDVTCEALQLALTALHIDMAWHAGVMSAEASIEALDREVGRTTSRYNRSARASAPEEVTRVPSRTTAADRATASGGKSEYDPAASHMFRTA